MRFLYKLLYIASILLMAGTCIAAEPPDERLVQALMQASGLEKQIEQVPLLVQMEIRKQHQKSQSLSADEYNRIMNLVKQSFDAKTMKYDVSRWLTSDLPEMDIKAALGWLESPLGRKITKLEERASTPEAYAEMQSMAPKLLKEYEGTSRLDKISRFDQATMTTERSVNMMLDLQLAIITAMSAAGKEEVQPSHKEIRESLLKVKPQIRDAAAQSTALSFLYTYRALTESEIDMYIAFAESDTGRRYHLITYKGVHDAITKAARKLGARIGMKTETI